RTAMAGANGQVIANAVGMRTDPIVQAAMLGQTFNPVTTPPVDGPGFPVLVDPIGVFAYGGPPLASWVSGTPNSIPRVCGQWGPCWAPPVGAGPPGIPNLFGCLKWCTVQDDLEFASDVDPLTGSGFLGLTANPPSWIPAPFPITVFRNARYSMAWML